jgi:hypothetical protein
MRRMCAMCGKPAVYDRKGRRGKMKSRTDHDLCQRHWRAVLDKVRAEREEVESELCKRQTVANQPGRAMGMAER